MNTEETIIVVIIKLIICIGLITYVYYTLIKKLSNNYKVLVLPAITFISSIIFGYNAYKVADDITLIIWFVIFLTSLLLIVLVFRKIYSEKYKPAQTTINNTEINHNYPKKINSIEFNNKNYNQFEILNQLENENIIFKNEQNIKIFNAILNLEKVENKIKWIDPNPNFKKENNLSTLIFFIVNTFSINNMKPIDIYNYIFLQYFDLGDNRVTEFNTFQTTLIKVNAMKVSELNPNYLKISEILKINK